MNIRKSAVKASIVMLAVPFSLVGAVLVLISRWDTTVSIAVLGWNDRAHGLGR